jgi:hypothetical protein
MKAPRVIVVIRGGVCQGVFTDKEINLDLLDWDNIEDIDPETTDQDEKERLEYAAKLEAETEKLPHNYYP